MKGQFLQITFSWADAPKEKELEAEFNRALDWMRYAANCWIVYTTSTPVQWFQRLKPRIGEHDYLFICTVDLSPGKRAGRMPPWAWDWISKHRTSGLFPGLGKPRNPQS